MLKIEERSPFLDLDTLFLYTSASRAYLNNSIMKSSACFYCFCLEYHLIFAQDANFSNSKFSFEFPAFYLRYDNISER